MKKAYIIYGTIICLLFAYATYSGWDLTDAIKSGKWDPKGHSVYHK